MVGIEAFLMKNARPQVWVSPTPNVVNTNDAVAILNHELHALLHYKRNFYGRKNIMEGDFTLLKEMLRNKVNAFEAQTVDKGMTFKDIPNMNPVDKQSLDDVFNDWAGYGQIGRGLLRGWFQLPP